MPNIAERVRLLPVPWIDKCNPKGKRARARAVSSGWRVIALRTRAPG